MKSTTNLRKKLNMFKSQVEAVQKSWSETNEELGTERGRRYAAERELETIRKQFIDLKERLHNAEMLNARNEGYLERVREDDRVSDPLIEIDTPEGKRTISKRHPVPMAVYNPSIDGALSQYRAGEKRKHWFNF